MAICMKLSPHVCEDSCLPSPSQLDLGDGFRTQAGRSRVTTVIATRVPDAIAAEIKRLAGKSGEGNISDWLRNLIQTQALRKR